MGAARGPVGAAWLPVGAARAVRVGTAPLPRRTARSCVCLTEGGAGTRSAAAPEVFRERKRDGVSGE